MVGTDNHATELPTARFDLNARLPSRQPPGEISVVMLPKGDNRRRWRDIGRRLRTMYGDARTVALKFARVYSRITTRGLDFDVTSKVGVGNGVIHKLSQRRK